MNNGNLICRIITKLESVKIIILKTNSVPTVVLCLEHKMPFVCVEFNTSDVSPMSELLVRVIFSFMFVAPRSTLCT